MNKTLIGSTLALALAATPALADVERYVIDDEHSFVSFRISHLGFAWMYGRFNHIDGEFTYDTDDPANSEIEVTVNTESIDTNHSERDRHLRSDDFLDVSAYPEATFTTTDYDYRGNGEGTLHGELTLHGTTREIAVDVTEIGEGEDPWGGYRRGFEGTFTLTRADFGIDYDLGEEAEDMELQISIEGIRQ